ncbi:MAG: DUF1653 domain-containing protein [Alphaproteobacteria bacterium]|nr:DUF1653 domain-containing protein [Alphaproteobacteria bacterium]
MRLGIYEHYKGFRYEVMGICRHTETLEELVVYRALYGAFELWVRPKEMFLETVLINGTTVPRFKFLSELEPMTP